MLFEERFGEGMCGREESVVVKGFVVGEVAGWTRAGAGLEMRAGLTVLRLYCLEV